MDVADNLASVLVMAEETPKKIVDESWKCFTCSSPCSGKQRIYIFGSSAHNFAETIKSSLNIDVKSYAIDDTNNKLFACKTVCYYRLLKFQRAVEKVNEVKREIQAAFQTRPRAKQLLRPPDDEETREIKGLPPTDRRRREHFNLAPITLLPLVLLLRFLLLLVILVVSYFLQVSTQ